MEQTTHRQNKKRYGWLILFTLINWAAIVFVVVMVDPETMKDFIVPGSYLPMVLLVSGGIFWLLSILFMSAVRALWWTIGITLYLFLRVLQLGTIMNGVLILGLLASWEVYQLKTRPRKEVIV